MTPCHPSALRSEACPFGPSPEVPAHVVTRSLTELEATVVALSLGDPAWSVRRHKGLIARLKNRDHIAQPLSNSRLEGIRPYAVMTRTMPGHVAERARLADESGITVEQRVAIDRFLGRADTTYATTRGGIGSLASVIGIGIGIGLFLSNTLFATAAHAQTARPIDTPVEIPADGQPDGPSNGPGDGNHFAIGVGAAFMPAFQGSKKYRVQPLPAIDIKWNRFFVNFQDGIGANLIDNETLTIGAGVVMIDNYRKRDVPKGIGRVPFGAGARGFVKLRQAGFEAVVGGTQGFVGGTKGFVIDASISRPIMVSEKFMLNPSIGTTWANAKHNDRYFGVNEQQSLASGLPQYRLGSGFVNAKAEVAAQYRLTERIGVGVVGGVSTLMGDAKASPFVQKKTAPYGIFFVSYGF